MQELFNYKVTSLKSLKTSADAFEMVVGKSNEYTK